MNKEGLKKIAESMRLETSEAFYARRRNLEISKDEFINFCYELGELVPSGTGHELVDSIKTSTTSGELEVPMHNDKSYWFIPPKFLIFFVAKFSNANGGLTELSDMYQSYASLSQEQQTNLATQKYLYKSPPNREEKYLLGNFFNSVNNDNVFFRYRTDIVAQDEDIAAFDRAVQQNKFPVELVRGDLLVIDNWRLAHGRDITEFASDGEREIYRGLVL